jgi:hypothetical protein
LGYGISRISEKIAQTGKVLKAPIKPALPIQAWKFTISILVEQSAIPPGLARMNYLALSAGDAPAIEIECADPRDYALKGEGRCLLFIRTRLPYREETLHPDYQRMIAARLLQAVCAQIPFLEQNIVSIYPEFRHPTVARVGDELVHLYGYSELREIPENLRCYGETEGLGFESGLEGLFVATDESYPKLGGFGSTLAAVEAVHGLAQSSQIEGVFT